MAQEGRGAKGLDPAGRVASVLPAAPRVPKVPPDTHLTHSSHNEQLSLLNALGARPGSFCHPGPLPAAAAPGAFIADRWPTWGVLSAGDPGAHLRAWGSRSSSLVRGCHPFELQDWDCRGPGAWHNPRDRQGWPRRDARQPGLAV